MPNTVSDAVILDAYPDHDHADVTAASGDRWTFAAELQRIGWSLGDVIGRSVIVAADWPTSIGDPDIYCEPDPRITVAIDTGDNLGSGGGAFPTHTAVTFDSGTDLTGCPDATGPAAITTAARRLIYVAHLLDQRSGR